MSAIAQRVDASAPSREVDVLMATFNGSAFLDEQIDSILAQRDVRVRLLVRDDGSTDDTIERVRRHALAQPGRIIEVDGMASAGRLGPAANFFALLERARTTMPPAEWIAFADQDDVWFLDKLSRAISALQKSNTERQDAPALYGSATILTDASGRRIGRSPRFDRPPAFAHALVQNIAAGNTMVMNIAAADLVLRAGRPALPLHDWWCYQLVTGSGGSMLYDDEPSLLYRQHSTNVLGAGAGLQARVGRWRQVLDGRYGQRNRAMLAELSMREGLLTPDARRCLSNFRKACISNSALARLRALLASGVYRQTWAQNALLGAACAGRRL